MVGERGVNFSGGQKQRLNLLRTLILDTDLIILDEPLNGLDFQSIRKIMNILQEKQQEGKRRNPIINVLKTEWEFLGRRRKIFLFYMFMFSIAGAISLMTPLVIGLIFNSIQQTISSDSELRKLIFMIIN